MAYILEKWDAIELFCRIVSKKEEIALKDFQNNLLLMHQLDRYSNAKRSEILSREIMKLYRESISKPNKTRADDLRDQKDSERENVRLVYQLSKDIRTSMPVRIEDFSFNACLHYVGNKKFSEEKRTHLSTFVPSNKQRVLEGTRWWVYFSDEWNKMEGGKVEYYKGISRGVLYLNPFGKAEFIRNKNGTEEVRTYAGTFEMYGDEKYLSLRMKLKKSQGRDLKILFYIGSEEHIELALGIAGNVSESFWSRTVMIEPIDQSKDKKPLPNFYSKDLSNSLVLEIPDYVWDCFDEGEMNIIRIPHTVVNKESFYEWCKSKSND